MLTTWGLAHVEEIASCAPDQVRQVLVDEQAERRTRPLRSLLDRHAIPWRLLPREKLVAAGGRDARLAVAVLRPFAYSTFEELIGSLPPRAMVLALDQVTDPGNLGALVRSALFFGVAGIILPERNAVGVTPAVVRRSAGAVTRMPIVRVTNLARALGRLKDEAFWVYGTTPAGGSPLGTEPFAARSCVVLGAEGKGLRPLVSKTCDIDLTLDGEFESLNVSAFAAVVLYEWQRSRDRFTPE